MLLLSFVLVSRVLSLPLKFIMYMSVEHSPSILVSVHTVKAIFSFDDHGILDKQAMVLIRKNIVIIGSTGPDITTNLDITADLNIPIQVLFTMICVSESAIFTNL